jgi:hypothetical protein
MRQVIAAMRGGNGRAQRAFDMFVHRLRSSIGSMLAGLMAPTQSSSVRALEKILRKFAPRHAATLRFWGSTSIRTKTRL